MENKKVIYYKDELNDEFSEAKIKPRRIDENYVYVHKNLFWNFCSFLVQNVFSMPIKVLYSKLKFRHKFVGKEKLKPYKKQGYFIYANHTQAFADTFIPSLANFPKRNFLIVNPENVSMKGMQTLVEMLGAIPIPCNKEGMKNFLEAIKNRINKGYSISIYPEAHIWPYYTKIRNFKDVSFKYPVELNTPTFCITNTYQARGKNKDKIQLISYIDGPFFADKNEEEDKSNLSKEETKRSEANSNFFEEETLKRGESFKSSKRESLNKKQMQKNLRDKVYKTMLERSKKSNIEYIKYIRIVQQKIEQI